MSSVFEGFEADFQGLASEVSRRISELSDPEIEQSSHKRVTKKTRELLREADQCLRSMGIEARNQKPNVRRALAPKIDQYKGDLANLKRDFERELQKAKRDQLMRSTPEDEMSAKSRDQRERAMDASRTMTRGTQRLEQTRQTLRETEDIGVNIMTDLHHQRETLLRTHDKVKETNALTNRARRILTGIKARACTNKLILWAIIILLLGLIGVVIYLGLRKL